MFPVARLTGSQRHWWYHDIGPDREPHMALQHRSFPFRWVLPSAQLLICLVLLWPVRNFLLFGVMGSIASYSSPNLKYVIVPPLTREGQRRVDAVVKVWEIRKTAPLALNFPVLIAQLPYVL